MVLSDGNGRETIIMFAIEEYEKAKRKHFKSSYSKKKKTLNAIKWPIGQTSDIFFL